MVVVTFGRWKGIAFLSLGRLGRAVRLHSLSLPAHLYFPLLTTRRPEAGRQARRWLGHSDSLSLCLLSSFILCGRRLYSPMGRQAGRRTLLMAGIAAGSGGGGPLLYLYGSLESTFRLAWKKNISFSLHSGGGGGHFGQAGRWCLHEPHTRLSSHHLSSHVTATGISGRQAAGTLLST